MAYLLVRQPDRSEVRVDLDRPRVRAGRSGENEICLSRDITVSRFHAEFLQEAQQEMAELSESADESADDPTTWILNQTRLVDLEKLVANRQRTADWHPGTAAN